jgi:hypothetical protein
MISQRGYHEARDSFDPAQVYEYDQMVGDIREMFLEQSLDERIEAALPVLARLKETSMKEANEFENWAQAISEGTWALPDTPEQMKTLQTLMSQPLTVGPDATNATSVLYDIIGDDELFDRLHDLADQDANADARDIIQTRLNQLGIDLPKADAVAPKDMAENVNKTTYAEELAEKLFDDSPNLQNQDDIISAGYVMSKQDPRLVGRVDGIFRDKDFLSDFVSVYRYIQHNYGIRSGVEEDLDTDGVMMTKPSNMSSESIDPVLRLKQMIKY